MRFCQPHWDLARELVEKHGLMPLVAKDGQEAIERTVGELQGQSLVDTFDPLMGIHWHYANGALECGGLAMLTPKDDGTPRCPVCEYVANMPDFDARTSMEQNVVMPMAEYARSEGLLPKAS
jgi:hypothetical protein